MASDIPPTIPDDPQNNPNSPVPPVKTPIAEGRCFLTWLLWSIITPLCALVIWIGQSIVESGLSALGADKENALAIGGIVALLLYAIFSFLAFRFFVVR
ncbi:MAG: hypothetical protein IJT88_09780 [Kiritimatiellae bacterium]|nr:hypothetical protein [Kiritimatiellia bacterium]